MTPKGTSQKTPHNLPADLKQGIATNPKAQAVWDDITPLAHNELICWVTSGKKAETQNIRMAKQYLHLKQQLD